MPPKKDGGMAGYKKRRKRRVSTGAKHRPEVKKKRGSLVDEKTIKEAKASWNYLPCDYRDDISPWDAITTKRQLAICAANSSERPALERKLLHIKYRLGSFYAAGPTYKAIRDRIDDIGLKVSDELKARRYEIDRPHIEWNEKMLARMAVAMANVAAAKLAAAADAVVTV